MLSTKTHYKLNLLTDEKLHTYFCNHARYVEDAPPDAKYVIRLGSRHLHSGDTKDLFEAFVKAVRDFTMPVLPHVWGLGGVCTKCGEKLKRSPDGSIDETEQCQVRIREYKNAN